WPWVVGNLTSYDIEKKTDGVRMISVVLPGLAAVRSSSYEADLIFTYYVDGVEYQTKKKSKRYATSRSLVGMIKGDQQNPKEKAEEDIRRRYAQLKVYYNPKNPNKKIINQDTMILKNFLFISIVAISLIFLLRLILTML
ncbi:MAG: hypothetical protein ACFFBD_09020, partial [Candidatus Hodarchaeota archaeon]